ncbi:MAG: 23S rRNA pseudouridine(1911/1915/1917) synthase RluD [Stagnimonas sp.]|nr:23S rRNA pseudouridine(1911/1915/1917) synthase RluD [Stagnimonas sp.]
MGKKTDQQYSPEPKPASSTLLAEVEAAHEGARLDAACAHYFPDYSRMRLKTWIEAGRLRLNGSPCDRPRQPVAAGDQLRLEPEAQQETAARAQDLALAVVYADAHLLVINKPAGFTVHPGAGAPDGTVQNALLHHYPQTARVPRAGLIHRLDKNTTGLMVVALDEAAHTALTAAMARREIRREYDALVNGSLVTGGTVDAPLGRHPRDRIKRAVIVGGRPAVTHFQVAERFAWHSLLRVQLETGRTHQIRVHFAHIKHPVTGDPVYGGESFRARGASAALRAAVAGLGRQALHAARLGFRHPVSGEFLSFEAPRPADFEALLAQLRRESPG